MGRLPTTFLAGEHEPCGEGARHVKARGTGDARFAGRGRQSICWPQTHSHASGAAFRAKRKRCRFGRFRQRRGRYGKDGAASKARDDAFAGYDCTRYLQIRFDAIDRRDRPTAVASSERTIETVRDRARRIDRECHSRPRRTLSWSRDLLPP
jgi:hypothetical protein